MYAQYEIITLPNGTYYVVGKFTTCPMLVGVITIHSPQRGYSRNLRVVSFLARGKFSGQTIPC